LAGKGRKGFGKGFGMGLLIIFLMDEAIFSPGEAGPDDGGFRRGGKVMPRAEGGPEKNGPREGGLI
jgi:hypothetical protein